MHYIDKCKLDEYMNPHMRNDIINTIIYTLIVYLIFNEDSQKTLSILTNKNTLTIQLIIFSSIYYVIQNIN